MICLISLAGSIAEESSPDLLSQTYDATELGNSIGQFSRSQQKGPNSLEMTRVIWSSNLISVVQKEMKCAA